MLNPFVFGREVSGDNFCNRKNEIKELSRHASNSGSVIIFSQRRYGKTSLVKEVIRKISKKEIFVIYVDLYAVLNEKEFVKKYASTVSQCLDNNIDKALKEARKLFSRIRPVVTVNEEGKPVFSVNLSEADPTRQLEEVIDSVDKYARNKKKRGLVVFDEFQQINEFDTDKVEKVLRSHIQTHKSVAYFFMGSKKHLMIDMFSNKNRSFYKSAHHYPLKKIDNEELVDFLVRTFKRSGKPIPENIAEKIVEICESHPYYVQYLANTLWDNIEEKEPVDEGKVVECVNYLIDKSSAGYESTWDLLTKKQKQTLYALAASDSDARVYSAEFVSKYDLGSHATVQRSIKSLLEKNIIDKEAGQYVVIDLFFKQWLKGLK